VAVWAGRGRGGGPRGLGERAERGGTAPGRVPGGGGGTPEPWQAMPASEVNADFSPDGRWLAYSSNVSGRFEIYVGSVQGETEGRIPVTTEGGQAPVWSPTGDRLFCRQGAAVMAVEVVSLDPPRLRRSPTSLRRRMGTAGARAAKSQDLRCDSRWRALCDGPPRPSGHPGSHQHRPELVRGAAGTGAELKAQIRWLRVFVEGVY